MSFGRKLVLPILGAVLLVQAAALGGIYWALHNAGPGALGQTTSALQAEEPVWPVLAVGLIAEVVVALLSIWLIDRRIAQPLDELTDEIKRIGQGDYTPPAALSRQDEVGRLSLALTNMSREIAEREYHIRDMALYEPVTHLANRAAFLDMIAPRLGAERAAILAIGLVRAQEITNTVGRDIADRVLRHVATRLVRLLGEGPPVACLGDRSFAVFLRDVGELKARDIAAGIIAEFETPFTDGDLAIDTVAAVGIALLPVHGDEGPLLLRRAEVALQSALRSEHRWAVYDPASDPHRPERLSLMSELRHGLVAGEFNLVYQPKLHVPTRRINAAEALVRWHHPRRGLVPPDEFVTLAEETGNVGHITRWALRTGIAQAAAWRAEGIDIQIAINVSARDLGDARLPDSVTRMLAEHSLDPSAISLEVTESAIMADPVAAVAVLRRFTGRGIGVALDDFGIGQASLAYLRTLPVREVKIDKAFVLRLAEAETDRKIVRSVIELGHSLGFKVSVEGVENAETLEILAGLGCDYAQGYYIARPLVSEMFVRFVRQPPSVPAASTPA